jgi:protein-tyrosine phosphatase
MKEKKIGGVVNCTPSLPNHFSCDPKVQYLRVPVHDSLESRDIASLQKYLPVACHFIHKVRFLEDTPVLVHCQAGKQRSATVVAAFLIMFYACTPQSAMRLLLERKQDVFHNGKHVNFAGALNRFYHTITQAVTPLPSASATTRT